MSLEAPINRFEHREMIDAVHKEIKEKFEAARIDPKGFDRNTVEADLAYVEKMEQKFNEEKDPAIEQSQKLADILEYLVYFHGEQSDWLGDGVETLAPSRFDDIKNKVDVLVKIIGEGGSLPQVAGLGMDATTSHNSDILSAKLRTVKEEIERGQATEVRYFDDSYFKGVLKMVPRIIVAADQSTVIRLAEFFSQESGGNQALAEDVFQYQLLEQILKQCEVFGKLAEARGETEIANKYKLFASQFKPVFEEKMRKAQEQKIFEVPGDDAHEKLMRELGVIDMEMNRKLKTQS